MKNRKKYKFQGGIQRIENDTPDYSNAYKLRAEQNAKNQVGQNLAKTGLDIAGTAIGVPGLGGITQGVGAISDAAFKDAKGNYKNKTSELLANQFNPLDKAGKSLSAVTGMLGGNFKNNTAAADLFSGSLIGTGLGALGMKNPFGKTTQEKVKEDAQKAEEATKIANINKRYSEGTATDAQASLAKRGKYKVKTKQPRLIETEGREPIFSPKKADGTRDLLYYNPNDPTHEEGGVKAVVMPRNRYNNGTNNLMPKRSKVSLLGSGNMAYGAKQVKVNDLNNAAFSQNFNGMPSANAANKFIQPTAGLNQVARQIPDERRKEKIRTPRSHKTAPVDSNRIIDPPMLYEMKPPPPRSTFNTKNNFKKGGSYIKTYQIGTEAAATYKHTKTFKSKPAYQAALQAHDDSLNLYGQSRYFTDVVKGSNLYQPTVENPSVKNITRTGVGKASSPTKPFGSPDDATEDVMSVAGINPMRKDLYSRKESKYKSFKEYEEAKASGQASDKHEGYEINMYKHPEMALNYEADTTQPLQIKKPKLNLNRDSSFSIKTPSRVNISSDTTSTEKRNVVTSNKNRGKFVGREKTFMEKIGEKAGELLDKVGPSNRMSNGKKVKVYK